MQIAKGAKERSQRPGQSAGAVSLSCFCTAHGAQELLAPERARACFCDQPEQSLPRFPGLLYPCHFLPLRKTVPRPSRPWVPTRSHAPASPHQASSTGLYRSGAPSDLPGMGVTCSKVLSPGKPSPLTLCKITSPQLTVTCPGPFCFPPPPALSNTHLASLCIVRWPHAPEDFTSVSLVTTRTGPEEACCADLKKGQLDHPLPFMQHCLPF